MISEHLKIKHKMQEDVKTFADMMRSEYLSGEEKKILHMIYIEKKDYRYIGDELGVSESTIKKRHNRILKTISKILQAGL